MSRVSTYPHSAPARPQVSKAHSEPVRPPLRLSRALPRVAVGATAALAAVSAAFLMFGPFSDLSAQQLAAGPHSAALGSDGKPLVLAATGRAWGAEYQRRASAASAAPLAKLARAPSADMGSVATAQVSSGRGD
jgi:hypothetical protein